MKLKKEGRFFRFLRLIYLKLFRIHDTPQRIAVGLGAGVFLGIIPGTGPLVALFAAFLFRLNRAAALLGSLLTNTWLSFLTFVLSIKIGSAIMGLDWQIVYQNLLETTREFQWTELFKQSFLKVGFPLLVGYCIIGFCLGFVAYILALAVLKYRLKIRKRRL